MVKIPSSEENGDKRNEVQEEQGIISDEQLRRSHQAWRIGISVDYVVYSQENDIDIGKTKHPKSFDEAISCLQSSN